MESKKYQEILKDANEVLKSLDDGMSETFRSYIDKLESGYSNSETEAKISILGELEKIVVGLTEVEAEEFDREKARQIRLDAGLQQMELAKITGVTPTYITHIEKGDRVPSPVSKSNLVKENKGIIGYLTWLKDQGYNPFKL
jgi:DNA-binding transcriptional regulator YiaG